MTLELMEYRKAERGEVNCGLCKYGGLREKSGRIECTYGTSPYYVVSRKFTCRRAAK